MNGDDARLGENLDMERVFEVLREKLTDFFVFLWQEAASEFADDNLSAEFGKVIGEFNASAAGADDESRFGRAVERKCLGGREAGGRFNARNVVGV